MTRLADYLVKNYYDRLGIKVDRSWLIKALEVWQDKVVVVHEGMEFKGVAVFATLSDESYREIDHTDIADPAVLGRLLSEQGRNIHFVLLVADSLQTILAGLRAVLRERPAKSVSWWSPDMKRVHRRNLN